MRSPKYGVPIMCLECGEPKPRTPEEMRSVKMKDVERAQEISGADDTNTTCLEVIR